MKFKTLTVRLVFIVCTFAIFVAGAAAGYMQTRIVSETGRYLDMSLQYEVLDIVERCVLELSYDSGDRIGRMEDLIKNSTLFDTGFVLLENGGEFSDTNSFISSLGKSEKDNLINAGKESGGETYRVTLNGKKYVAAMHDITDGYNAFAIVPVNEYNAEITASLMRFAVIFIVLCSLIIASAYFVTRPIARPLIAISGIMKRAATTGNIRLSRDDNELIKKYSQIRDETGQMVRDFEIFINHIATVDEALKTVASGDLTYEVKLLSDTDVMGLSIKNMVDNLNNMFSGINASIIQVSTGAKQIADSSQSLAQGSTEQAASVEQLSSSISIIAAKTKENAEMAERAAELAGTIMGNAEKGNRQMDEMMAAVKEINQASHEISKVIKVIDDIAFQTNILALNAAVEAARAGQHGKGFAVVAEEVRNLASKSAEAAKETGNLIVNSTEKAELGSRIAAETSDSLTEIVQGINESSQLISQIAQSSEEQTTGISQINVGIDQVAQVIQQNSSTAQESSAASVELSGQSNMLQGMVEQFKLKADGDGGAALPSHASRKQLPLPQ